MTFMNRFKQRALRKKIEDRVVGWAMTVEEVQEYFRSLNMHVLTFFGYSGMGYESDKLLLEKAREILNGYTPEKTIVNLGVTAVGLGQIYPLAKELGFKTAGIVSTQALDYLADVSDDVDHICFVEDGQWGGFLPNTQTLSPTSEAMISVSNNCVAIGGNEVSRDELLSARRRGIPVLFIPADVNHANLIHKTSTKGLPRPESFEGEAHQALADKDKKE